MHISYHAKQRLQQRGMSETDVDLILRHGTETQDGFLMRRKDVQRAEKDLRCLINELHRLKDKYVVVRGNTVVTAYHARKTCQNRALRR